MGSFFAGFESPMDGGGEVAGWVGESEGRRKRSITWLGSGLDDDLGCGGSRSNTALIYNR